MAPGDREGLPAYGTNRCKDGPKSALFLSFRSPQRATVTNAANEALSRLMSPGLWPAQFDHQAHGELLVNFVPIAVFEPAIAVENSKHQPVVDDKRGA